MHAKISSPPPFCLHKGDKVALTAPASGQKEGETSLIKKAIQLLLAWELQVTIIPTFADNSSCLSANDKTRADNLIATLTHPDIKAIFVTRGGYGCARLLPYLSNISPPSPRFLLGFSDITTLHLCFSETKNLYCVHTLNLATQQCLDDSESAHNNRDTLHRFLFKSEIPYFNLSPINTLAKTTSLHLENQSRTGGCLSLLVTSLATKHEIDTRNKVLLIEEVNEVPYKIDRMLTHLKNAEKLDNITALIWGEMVGCNHPNMAVIDLLKGFFTQATFPVYLTQDFGHGDKNLPWTYCHQ
ncbi:MAG: S66 peptidase family protein [Ostreibacterium sp.]